MVSPWHLHVLRLKVKTLCQTTNRTFVRILMWIRGDVFAIESAIWLTLHTFVTTSCENKRVVYTVYPKKYAHGFVVLCFVAVMQSFIMNSREVFIHIHQGCFAGTGPIVRLPQCQWSKPDGYGKISQCITTTKHSKAKNRVHISWDILY